MGGGSGPFLVGGEWRGQEWIVAFFRVGVSATTLATDGNIVVAVLITRVTLGMCRVPEVIGKVIDTRLWLLASHAHLIGDTTALTLLRLAIILAL